MQQFVVWFMMHAVRVYAKRERGFDIWRRIIDTDQSYTDQILRLIITGNGFKSARRSGIWSLVATWWQLESRFKYKGIVDWLLCLTWDITILHRCVIFCHWYESLCISRSWSCTQNAPFLDWSMIMRWKVAVSSWRLVIGARGRVQDGLELLRTSMATGDNVI